MASNVNNAVIPVMAAIALDNGACGLNQMEHESDSSTDNETSLLRELFSGRGGKYFFLAWLLAQETDYDESSTDDGTSSEDDSDNRHRERRQRVAMYSHLSNRENKISQAPENHPSQTGYLYVISQYSDADFWLHFRVSRSTFQMIGNFLRSVDFEWSGIYHGGFQPMSIDEMLYITLQYLGSQGPIRLLADQFGRTNTTIWNAVRRITHCFYRHQSKFIAWPKGEELGPIQQKFEERAGFPGTVGVVDGCHIQIHPPTKNPQDYYNFPNRFHSIVLLAIVLPDKRFSYAFTGFPGMVNDSHIFQRSSLYQSLNDDNSRESYLDSKKQHIIGDSAFALHSWLLVPYNKLTSKLTASQKLYNQKLSATRVCAEQAFGDLKKRFRRLQNIRAKVENCVEITCTATVLHNMCITNGDFPHLETGIEGIEDVPSRLECKPNVTGIRKREAVRCALERRQQRRRL